jgi:hypothetical protein
VKLFRRDFRGHGRAMKKLWPILFLVAGCGAKNGADTNAEAVNAAAAADLMPNLAEIEAASAVNVQALIDRAMPAALPDAKTAQYRNVRPGAGGAACGEVSGKTTKGFVPFVITPAAVAIVGTSPRVAFEDPSDFLADAYIRWCATPEELRGVAPAIQQAKADPGPGNLAVPAPEVPLPVPAPAPADAKPAKPVAPPPPPQIGSFFNSVQRGH